MFDSTLAIDVLGPLRVQRAGVPVPVGGRQQRAVLAALVVHHPSARSVDQLADAVWSGQPRDGYVTTLRTYIHRLRRALEPDRGQRPWRVIVRDDGGYRLELAHDALDVCRFRRHVADGRAWFAAGDFAAAHAELSRAEGLLRGEPLADLAELGFVKEWADRVCELRLEAAEADLEAQLRLGADGALVPVLAELVAAHPFRERFHGMHMLALYRSGRQAEALAAYRTLHTLLDAELGVTPSDEVRRLHQAMLEHDPGLVPAVTGGARTPLANIPSVRGRRWWRGRLISSLISSR